MRKALFTKDWLKLHPYKTADDVDQYYTQLANKIYQEQEETCFNELFDDEEDAKHLALCIAAYFEDVISGIGIWRAFTTECQKRYGVFVPFYTEYDKGTYYQDEINMSDIMFLLWHHFQQSIYKKEALPPLFGGIMLTATRVYKILETEYETAPENERLYEYLCTSETDENHFYDYRNILEWFHFSCYFNVGNKKRFEEEINKKAILDEQANIMLYSTRIESLMNSRYNLLALSSAEWLAKISEQHPAHKLWTDIDYRGSVFFTVTKEDEQFIYVKDLFQDDTLKVNKNSIQLDDFGEFLNGNSVMVTNMFKFGNAWWQNGALLSYPLDKKMKEVIDKEKDEKLHKQMLLDYELVKKSGYAHKLAFLKDDNELLALYKKAGYKIAKGFTSPQPNAKAIILSGSPYTGNQLTYELAHCICDKDNPFYDSIKAEKDAFDIISGCGNAFPYETVCHLIDHHMIPDANVFGKSFPKDEGIRITQENLQFLADYHLRGRRDKDLSPTELW
ncbi:MAG TPA: DUF3843 family protein [Prevotella sp.]|nr:DUF3843 family protein [Prevotella sp.]